MPMLALDQADIGFVDQSGRLERVAGRFLGQLLRGQFTKLLIDEGQ